MYTAYGIVTLCEWSWWSYSTLVERELHNHHNHLQRVTIPYAVYIQFDLLRMSIILFETCRGL